ncbi:MAG TPA: tRNA preQ1(34) S-adenosylmethionine ribosyltransferase-isomerase QueA [Methylomirabilota bacterium]|nr:tRNA preQ1(34) S-adenosylmethionine ribosyltransferase-isomerase QueA [Methylomirabilota bacterium]
MRSADFHFDLPPELVAQVPAPERDQSRLLVLTRNTGAVAHRAFGDLPGQLCPGDLLVLNDSKVIPARLRARNVRTGGEFELLLLAEELPNEWWCLVRPGKRAGVGTEMILHDRTGGRTAVTAAVTGINAEGHRRMRFAGTPDILRELDRIGEVPLPPYIKRDHPAESIADLDRYQTVYARVAGSVAAPTAGLHFTPAVLEAIRARGVHIAHVTLHVGLGTFAPVKTDQVHEHVMHEERFALPAETVAAIAEARRCGRRVIAVGTTTVRVLETVAAETGGALRAGSGATRIFIYPPYRFRVVDALLTNFHLPCSTLLMLVSAFAAPGEMRGRELILSAYAEAIRERYRFFSYGDAMFIE